jgi:hypothetical protein
MKATYQDFLDENPKCGKDLVLNQHAQATFFLLSSDKNIIAMIDASEARRPAIEATYSDAEDYFDRNKSSEFDLTNDHRRTVVGCMIKTILAPFGYLPVEPKTKTQKELSRSTGAKYFKSGSCYYFDPTAPASMQICRTVMEISQDQ